MENRSISFQTKKSIKSDTNQTNLRDGSTRNTIRNQGNGRIRVHVLKKNEETIEWNLPSQVVKASPGVRVQCLGFRVRIFKGPSVRGFLAQTGLKVHVSGGFKRPSRWPCVGWKRTQMARPTPPSLPPTCLAARAGLDMKMDFPSPSLAPSTCLSVSFHPSPSPPSLLPSSSTPQRTRRTNRFPHPARVNNVS